MESGQPLQERVFLFPVDGLELCERGDELHRLQRPELQLQDAPLRQRRVHGRSDVTFESRDAMMSQSSWFCGTMLVALLKMVSAQLLRDRVAYS